ncbi:hypothetical protein B0O99DRAFT_685872 [Bisporella sp. PMI_857]|nr:hypothetical protein B0O99DRAFT_685872 [Bisporella sp. PMI_857]
MTSHDVRDMLDLPGTSGPRPAKKQKIAAPRTNLKGLAREVQSLGGDNPIAIVPEVSVFKKRRLASRNKPAARWELSSFNNSARTDGLQLKHWKKKDEILPRSVGEDESSEGSEAAQKKIEDSSFAKFNVRINVPNYTNEEYKEHLESDDWSRHETDYLIELAQEFDLRWPVIWDRYEYNPPPPADTENAESALIPIPKVRTLEDLKARYYKVAAAMMKVHKPLESMNHSEFDTYEKMKNFNPAQETLRKNYAEKIFMRTKEEAKEEESLLLELKRILARSEKMGDERKELYTRLEAPASSSNMGIYSTSQGLQSLLSQLVQADKSKKRRPTLMDPSSGISPASGPGLQQLDRRDSGIRESMSGTSSGNKKGNAGASEHRQLSEQEEKIYGVTHPTDRSTSGPVFRHEKLNKLILNKSAIQQAKITNTLNELGIPSRLIMPTADVGAIWTNLLESIIKMLDMMRQVDKAKGELSIAKQQKAEREKKVRAEKGDPEPEADGHGQAESGIKQEEGSVRGSSVQRNTRAESAQRSIRGGSATHKRSASVLSTASDNGAKRQKN